MGVSLIFTPLMVFSRSRISPFRRSILLLFLSPLMVMWRMWYNENKRTDGEVTEPITRIFGNEEN